MIDRTIESSDPSIRQSSPWHPEDTQQFHLFHPITKPLCHLDVLVAPDSRPHITRSSRERTTRWARRNADDGVLVTLQHELRVSGSGIPELDTTVLGSGENPVSVGSKSNRENEVLVSLEGLDASSTFGAGVGVSTSRCNQLPHLDGLIQTT